MCVHSVFRGEVLGANTHRRNLLLHVSLAYKQTIADQTGVALSTYRTRYITLEGCLFYQDWFFVLSCRKLEKPGGSVVYLAETFVLFALC